MHHQWTILHLITGNERWIEFPSSRTQTSLTGLCYIVLVWRHLDLCLLDGHSLAFLVYGILDESLFAIWVFQKPTFMTFVIILFRSWVAGQAALTKAPSKAYGPLFPLTPNLCSCLYWVHFSSFWLPRSFQGNWLSGVDSEMRQYLWMFGGVPSVLQATTAHTLGDKEFAWFLLAGLPWIYPCYTWYCRVTPRTSTFTNVALNTGAEVFSLSVTNPNEVISLVDNWNKPAYFQNFQPARDLSLEPLVTHCLVL